MNRVISKIAVPFIIIIALLSSQVILPAQTYADSTLNWNNPNQGGDNSFKLSFSSVVNSGLLTSLVGCTGIVKKVAKFTVGLAKTIGQGLGLVKKTIDQPVTTFDDYVKQEVAKGNQKRDEDAFREECINGIAVRLARNQLTAITRNTMNWINTGFKDGIHDGSPFFVQNVDKFMGDITNKILEKETDWFKDPSNAADYPYGRDFARAEINASKAKNNFRDSLKQDLTGYLDPGSSPDTFATDFSQGGWDGWLALTQRPQNNPLGYTLLNSQHIADTQAKAVANQKEELVQSGGILSQKVCKVFGLTKNSATKKLEDLKAKAGAAKARAAEAKALADKAQADAKKARDAVKNAADKVAAAAAADKAEANAQLLLARVDSSIADLNAANTAVLAANANTAANADPNPNKDCTEWETVTPGSAIRDKITKTLNSPETQLELVRTLNDALNSLFAALLNNFQSQGLSSLTPKNNSNLVTPGNAPKFDTNGNIIPSGSGIDGAFDLTKDLGNQYNAATTKNNYIIDKKGVIQIQLDYIDTVKEAQAILPNVLPSVGALDYCIPGPNPIWPDNVVQARDEIIAEQAQLQIPFQSPAMVEQYWTDAAQNLSDEYSKKIEALYGETSPMQTEFLDTGENNPSYLKMTRVGLSITKNINTYADTIDQADTTYKNDIAQVQANIYRLNKIKDKVNVIITAAQKRRDTKRAQAGLPKITSLCIDTEKVTYLSNGLLK